MIPFLYILNLLNILYVKRAGAAQTTTAPSAFLSAEHRAPIAPKRITDY